MNTHPEPVDVLAVMDIAVEAARARLKDTQTEGTAAASAFRSSQLEGILQARAAIAELIATAAPVATSLAARIDADNAMTPQAVMTRRLVDAIARVGGGK